MLAEFVPLVMDDAPLEIALFGAVMAVGRRDGAPQPNSRAPANR